MMRDTPQTVPFRSPERFPVLVGASNVSQNARGDVADCKAQVPSALAGPDNFHTAITLNVNIATRHTRLMTRHLHQQFTR
jgi:hypothetical protein